MVHNKRLSVPRLIMSVHAGLISFPAFNKYVTKVIRHNFSTRRDLVQGRRARAIERDRETLPPPTRTKHGRIKEHANLHEPSDYDGHERCITLIFVQQLPRNVTELYAS